MINESIFESFPFRESERLLFRELTLEDASGIQSIRSDKAVYKYLDNKIHSTVGISETFLSNSIESFKTNSGISWAIIDKSSNQLIGDFAYWKLDKKNHRAEVGYTLKPEFWGRGLMTETMQVLLSFGFTDLNLHSIEANINPSNDNSKNLLLKMGFEKEAYFKENYFFDGNYLDSEIYSLLEKNFRR